MDTTDFESVASAVYEAIDSQLEPEEDEADDDGDMDDEEIQQYAKSSQCPSGDERTVATDHPHRSEEEMAESSSLNVQLPMDNETSPFVREKRSAPLIVQDDSGLIKKIKISTAKNLVQRFTQNMAANKTEKVIIKGLQQVSSNTQHQQQQQQQPRSSTPLSREYLALQKTQNDSKIIKKFVTDAMIEKTRKGKAKDSNNSFGSPTATPTSSNAGATPMIATSSDHSYTSRRRSNNNSLVSPEKDNTDSHSISQTKRHRRFVPLKDADDDDSATLQQPQRSRSKSMHNSSDHSDEHSNASSSHQMLKKWPSEERFPVGVKRTNMRSENSDFVQKQKDFLQQVINSTQDTPQRTHSRSRSIGGDSDSNPPPIKPRKSKERSSKRLAAEFEQGEQDKEVIPPPRTRSRSRSAGVDSFTTESANPTTSKRSKSKRSKDDTLNDDSADKQSQSQSIVMECSTTTDDHGDGADSSLNNSHNSTLATNTSSSADVTTTTTTTATATAATTTYAENVDSLENHLKKMWQPPPKVSRIELDRNNK